MPKYTKRSVALITAGVVAVSGGAAWAAWTILGDGSATATAGTAAELDITGTSITALVPGGTSDVTLTVSNPNTFPVKVTSLEFVSITTTKSGCDAAANVEFASEALPTSPATALDVPAKTGTTNGSKEITVAGALRMVSDADDDCQGASFTIVTEVDGLSNAA
ncbi:hypothetical protein Aca07nite_08880 [Actinoplanes capillaceus]|uniref:SipW-cognate class signal peptide n=1 Tax=Actinoplanes campanulatus TaxID=113559 RepID=A0ABQ3WBR5_9ACTN|nr:hypothetical protein [Actinoplanes capillaceus]GID43613.1 hypothetical protein Aca07nite_08880 [Actinoplanes capillaceus]